MLTENGYETLILIYTTKMCCLRRKNNRDNDKRTFKGSYEYES